MTGVSEWCWWDHYLQAREAMGVSSKGGLAYPLLCRFDDQGSPLADALQASEVGSYLRNVLKVAHASVNEIRSHSLKVTALSWMAKAGCSLSVRRSLGHHLDPGARSATIYSRDAMAPPLRELCRVIQLIASKQVHARQHEERGGSKQKCLLDTQATQSWTQTVSPASLMRCPSRSAWWATQMTQIPTPRRMLAKVRRQSPWTPPHCGNLWSPGTAQSWCK